MALRHVHGPYLAGHANRGADLFARMGIDQNRRTSGSPPRLFVLADEKRFGDADRWHVQQHAQVTSQSEPPRMRIPLSIAENQVGVNLQRLKGRQRRWNFAETEQSGNIGESQRLD